jgi:hypothetical protein
VVEEVAHPVATCLAAFDCAHDRVRIVVRDSYADLVEPGDPYALIPPDVLVRTLMFHEITHALIEQNAAGREVPAVDHEYIAAAMELEHMDPAWRQTLLDHARLDAPAEGRINIWIYRLEPRRFAANAWLHFRLPQKKARQNPQSPGQSNREVMPHHDPDATRGTLISVNHATRRYPPDSVTRRRALDGSGSIFWRSR